MKSLHSQKECLTALPSPFLSASTYTGKLIETNPHILNTKETVHGYYENGRFKWGVHIHCDCCIHTQSRWTGNERARNATNVLFLSIHS